MQYTLRSGYKFITKLSAALYNPEVREVVDFDAFRDCISDGQMASKLWLLELLCRTDFYKHISERTDIKMAIVGGWYGTLGLLFHCEGFRFKITSIDIDPKASMVAANFTAFTGVDIVTQDMFETDYSGFDIIVNTSSEHIENFEGWLNSLPKGIFVILQNNDFYDGKGHVNCFDSLESFVKMCSKFIHVQKGHSISASNYNRFMVMGFKL